METKYCDKNSKRTIRVLATLLFIVAPGLQAHAGQAPVNPVQAMAQPRLTIVVVEGEGAINNLRQRVARDVIVQVKDENDRPIGGAVVVFRLSNSGPGGTFSNGSNTLTVSTDAAGRAVANFTPNAISGAFQVSVTASIQGQITSAAIGQSNLLGAATAGTATGRGGAATGSGTSATTVAVVAAAAAAAVAVGVVVGKDEPPAPSTVRIGVGGPPSVGAPSAWQQSLQRRYRTPKWR